MKKILCFGEILLRISPDVNGTWLSSNSFPVYLGGAELNVANALARWGIPVTYCSAAPDNYMSREIKKELSTKGVDTTKMINSGDRIGIYYLAQGTDLKNSEVIYDRAYSSTAMLQPGQIDWEDVLCDIDWFHFSAISPAISPNLAAVCLEALQSASRKKIKISVDLNYRAKLWRWGKQPIDVMPELVNYCDVVMGNIWAAELMLGVPLKKDFTTSKSSCVEQAALSSEKIANAFSACTEVANTFRFDQGSSLQYYGTLYADGELFVSREHTASHIKDKVGSGDCFMAGLIYGDRTGMSRQQTIDFAAAAAVDKMFVVGDATTSSVEDVKKRATFEYSN